MNCTTSELQEKLQILLPKKRYNHTLGVTYTCAALAMKYDYNIEKAMIAGLLHDVAKYMSSKEILQKCIELNLNFTKIEEENPKLLHGKLGAYFAKRDFDVYDEDILRAITYHTTGYPSMNTLDKILFVADYIEPNREHLDGIVETRKRAFNDLDSAVICKIENVVSYLRNRGSYIDSLTLDTYEYYKRSEN